MLMMMMMIMVMTGRMLGRRVTAALTTHP